MAGARSRVSLVLQRSWPRPRGQLCALFLAVAAAAALPSLAAAYPNGGHCLNSHNVRKLGVNSTVRFDGDIWTLLAIRDTLLQLRGSRGQQGLFPIVEVVAAPDFAMADANGDVEEQTSSTFFDALAPEEQQRARKLEEHIQEARTGYRSGTSEEALSHEPRSQYDPAVTTQQERWEAKGQELKSRQRERLALSARRLRELASEYDKTGIWGLVDKRVIRKLVDPVDEKIDRAIREAIDDNVYRSNISKETFRKIVRARLDAKYGKDEVPLPKKSRFNQILDRIAHGRGIFGWSKTKRSIDNRPPRPYGRMNASRAGEIVEFDTTPLDVFGVDPVTFEWVRIELSVACDIRTHLVWPRLTPYSTDGFDASMLLFDLLRPKRRGFGPRGADTLPYLGVPEQIVLGQGQIPALLPESVTIDNGKVWRGEVFENACHRLGITMRYSRKYRPTDKPHVERFFRTVRHDVLELLPGYKGPGLYERGKAIERDAFYFIDELDDLIYSWVAEVYNIRRQDDLCLPERPGLPLSPFEMYAESLARVGSIPVPVDSTLYYELLPRFWRVINHYGVEVGGLIYDHEVLNPYRNERSPYNGKHAGKWCFQVDPGDRSEVYFRDRDSGVWFAIPWVGNRAAIQPRPFSEETVSYAKKLLRGRDPGQRRSNHEELVFMINELLDRLNAHIEADSPAERRALAREEMQRRAREADDRRPSPMKGSKRSQSVDDEAVLGLAEDGPEEVIAPQADRGADPAVDLTDIAPMEVVEDEPSETAADEKEAA